jgi:putative spermidine/putrescine transport system ATP-binding protein
MQHPASPAAPTRTADATAAPTAGAVQSAVPPAQPIVLDGLSHAYGSSLALDDVSMTIEGGELVALLGPSGCGKTTLLRIIAGFIAQSRGRVVVGGRVLDRAPPNLREIGIVFQNYALFPHMTVAQNIAYGLAARGEGREVQRERVAEMLDVVQMAHLRDRKPRELSGGQQQRVAIARALAVRPRVLLLDEPFAALDRNLRLDMQIEIKRLQRQFALTSILVTHDQDEAMSIADRIAVMNRGRVEQLADPVTVYDRPETLFVNNFIGNSNLLPGVVEAASGQDRRVRLDAGASWTVRPRFDAPVGARVLVSVRPEQLTVEPQTDAAAPADAFAAEVVLGMPIGGAVVHELRTPDGRAVKVSGVRRGGATLAPGAPALCAPTPDARPNVFAHDS